MSGDDCGQPWLEDVGDDEKHPKKTASQIKRRRCSPRLARREQRVDQLCQCRRLLQQDLIDQQREETAPGYTGYCVFTCSTGVKIHLSPASWIDAAASKSIVMVILPSAAIEKL